MKKLLFKGIFLFLVVVLVFVTELFAADAPAPATPQGIPPCVGSSTLSGTISSDEYWCISGSPYTVTGDLTIATGVTVWVDAGVVINVKTPVRGDGQITVNGTLFAIGTSVDPIVFQSGWSSPAAGDWERIAFSSLSSLSWLVEVDIKHAGAGAFDPGLLIQTDSFTLQNSIVRTNAKEGIRVEYASPSISNVAMEDNVDAAIILRGNGRPSMSGLTATFNSWNGIAIEDGVISSDTTWGLSGLTLYQIRDDVVIDLGAKLTITPGTYVFVKTPVRGDGRFVVNGTLDAQGTGPSPVTFTTGWSLLDPHNGDWEGILFNPGSTDNVLEYVVVQYGGAGMPMIDIGSSDVTVRNSVILHSLGHGIRTTNASPTITQNSILLNDNQGLRNATTATPVNAVCNWWGSASGPTNSGNPGGTGEEVSAGVTYFPWATSGMPGGECDAFYVFVPAVIR